MAGLINIGLTGLLSHQSALSTTGNNVTNANTPGYSRQQALFETLPSQYAGSGYVGTGVMLADIQRMNSEFVNQQLRSDTTMNGEQSALASELGRLDNLFASEDTGLNGAMNAFFAAVHDSAESPNSIPQRQLLISRGESLAQRFQTLSNKLEQHSASIEQQLTTETAKVNGLAQEIANLNLAISSSPGLSQGIQPNELMDQRDEKLRELAESVPIQTTAVEGGQVNVYFGNGQSLVNGISANKLSLSPEDPNNILLSSGTGAPGKDVTDAIGGGRIGGLLGFRDGPLHAAKSALDNIANGLAETFNTQHGYGYDLNGARGEDFFTAGGAAGIGIAISDPDKVALALATGEDGKPLMPPGTLPADMPDTLEGQSLNNLNALALADIATRPSVSLDPEGTVPDATLEDAYGLLVTTVGSSTSQAQSGLEASSTLLEQSSNSWQQQSGVNLDEEAGNLVRYQAAYNASAQVISVARDLFNTLLSSFR